MKDMTMKYESPATGKVTADMKVSKTVNYLLYRYKESRIIRELTVTNNSDENLEGLKLRFSTTPAFAAAKTVSIDVGPHSTYTMNTEDLLPNIGYLKKLDEKVPCTVHMTVMRGEEELFSAAESTMVQPLNEWPGYRMGPGLLACYILPNTPWVNDILTRASQLLKEETGNGSLSAYYWEKPERVRQTVGAIYRAIYETELVYAPMPASFEYFGQRVRMQDEVMTQKKGNCVELSNLFCAALEQAGLNPFSVGEEGHMKLGVWLVDETFPEITTTDATVVKNLLEQGKIQLIEATLCVQGTDFKTACSSAEDLSTFQYCIDIKKARMAGYTPLPLEFDTDESPENKEEENAEHAEDKPTAVQESAAEELEFLTSAEATTGDVRYARWRRENMDMTSRSALLHLKIGGTIPIFVPELDDLVNALQEPMMLKARPQQWKPKEELSFALVVENAPGTEMIQKGLAQKSLITPFTKKELETAAAAMAAAVGKRQEKKCVIYVYAGILRYVLPDKASSGCFQAPVLLYPAELCKLAGGAGYSLCRIGDAEINEVLIEKLRQYCGLDLSRLYDADLAQEQLISRTLGYVNAGIASMKDWSVVPTAGVAAFAMPSCDIYSELTNHRPAIEKHPIVESLMNGQLHPSLAEELHEDGIWEQERDLLLTMPLDPSQKGAVSAAARGKSFILYGGPGTGKSVTIAVILEDSITHKKRTIFISDKATAIEAVRQQLENHGIAPFCLHLTTGKQSKQYIVQQLQRVVDLQNCSEFDTDYQRQQIKTEAARSAFQGYYDVLYTPQPCGMSLHQLIDKYIPYEEKTGFQTGTLAAPEVLNDKERMEAQEDLFLQIADVAQQLSPAEHPLRTITLSHHTPEKEEALRESLSARYHALDALAAAGHQLSAAAGMKAPKTRWDYETLDALAQKILPWEQWPHRFQALAVEDYFGQLFSIADCYAQADKAYRKLKHWSPGFFDTDANEALRMLNEAEGKLIGRKQAIADVIAKFKSFSKYNLTKDTLRASLKQLQEYQFHLADAEGLAADYGQELPTEEWWNVDWNAFKAMVREGLKSWEMLKTEIEEERLYTLLQQPQTATAYSEAYRQVHQELSCDASEEDESWIENQQEALSQLLENLGRLKDWAAWNDLREKAQELNMSVVTDAYMAGFDAEKIENGYHKALYKSLITSIIASAPATKNYSGVKFRAMNRDLQRRSKHLMERSRDEARKRLGSNNLMEAATRNSDLSILLKWLKQPASMSVRELMCRIPELIFALCPCIIADSDAVAAYLPFAANSFDLVVFDEASQMTTAKSVSLLARGKQAIVCGDPNQMPPTRFFQRSPERCDDPELMDMENILDDLITLGMPQIQLKYHYRSKHEDLFAFNNAAFYQGRLVTLPGVHDAQSHVKLVRVNGIYESGNKRRNIAEANAIVEELKRRSQLPGEQGKSVLIVTFNVTQQAEIEARVEQACRNDPSLASWLYDRQDPLLIQNLENVQGDERDLVMLSVTYGPDTAGKISLNFGPLNQSGGFRRLNVATSRAREEMLVFASMGYESIDEKRTSAKGVLALRDFLRYAENGYLARTSDQMGRAEAQRESCMAQQITAALESSGYQVRLCVGHSAMRVDIAVVDQQDPSRYILGILLDEPSDLDRDALAFQLEGSGWEILQIHDLDYLGCGGTVISSVLQRLECLSA